MPWIIRWRNVPNSGKFSWVSIGVGLKIWGVGIDGNIYFRNGIDSRANDYCGTDWTQVMFSDQKDIDVRFSMVSVGEESVWAISRSGELYFRENVSKLLPLGTSWLEVDKHFKFVSVNSRNEVIENIN